MTPTKSSTTRSAWTEIRVDTPRGWHELVSEALALGPCTSIVLGPTSIAARQPAADEEAVRTFVMARDDTPELRREIQARLERLVETVADPELVGLEALFKPLPAEDYATSWKKSWKPFRVGRLALLPPWREEGPPRSTDIRLTIEPGGSFGSGRHATTRTCLREIDRRIREGDRVLDAGTGSGILSVAAALLGARETFGFDMDPASKPCADELAAANGVADRCTFQENDFKALEEVEGSFDAVFANIYADVLMTYCYDLGLRLKPDGWFVFSGCRSDHVGATREALIASDLVVDEERLRGRWMTFIGRRADAPA